MRVIEAERDVRGFDRWPDQDGHSQIFEHDFLSRDVRDHLTPAERCRPLTFAGNPPFGRRSATALSFLNRALQLGEFAGFILPVSFRKWSVQSRIVSGAMLVEDYDLPDDAFTILGESYSLRCCFQIWSMIDRGGLDLRIKSRPATSHADYWHGQWNRMPGSERVFEHEWDFAVQRQGFGSFEPVFSGTELDRRTQWALFQTRSPDVLRRLLSIDFLALAQANSVTPGYGKADVAAAYQRLLTDEIGQELLHAASLQAANSNSVCEAVAA